MTTMPTGAVTNPPKYCHACGAALDQRVAVCPRCGAQQMAFGRRSRLAAGLFGIFLGGLGIHKFYLGKVWQGVFYVLFCWTMIPSIAGLIEGILYLTMSDAEFAARYG